MRKNAIPYILVFVLMASLLPSCVERGRKAYVPSDLIDLSFSELWKVTVEATGVQGATANLTRFYLSADREDSINSLHFEFYGVDDKGNSNIYFVDVNPQGEMDWRSYEAGGVEHRVHPLVVFEKLDQVRWRDVGTGEKGLRLQIDFIHGKVRYSEEYTDIYVLETGELKALKEITFHSGTP